MTSDLKRAPAARTFSVADLMEDVQDGRIRIPGFQRNYRWEVEDVLNLLDSIYRGYPVGSLLLWARDAPHEVIALGSLRLEAEATTDALWVVDGQQRITSLAGVLLAAGDTADPRFSVYFDLDRRRFVRGRRPAPPHWLPMNRVIDTRSLLRWLGELQRSGGADQLVATAEDLSRRIREYKLPAYIVETADEDTLRTIFDRLNTFGKALTSAEVFHALHGGRRGEAPEDLRTLARQIADLGFGTLGDNSLLRAVLALRGADIYRDFRSEFREDEDPTDAFRETASAIARMIRFLRADAHIPHIKILPYRYVIPVLARFFHMHPNPTTRSHVLLRRWLWRDALTPEKKATSVSSLRATVRSIDDDEQNSVQRLLALVSSEETDDSVGALSPRLNEARARANTALMASWQPRSLVDGQPLNLAEHFETSPVLLASITDAPSWKGSLADRMIHVPTTSALHRLLVDSGLRKDDPVTFDETIESHAITPQAIESIERGDVDEFLRLRHEELARRLHQTGLRFAEWGLSDRPSISSLIVPEESDDG